MSSSSLSSVVSNLVRASMGSSVPKSVTDEELDRHVAELILKEAKQKAERYMSEGISAYLPDNGADANVPRANKRFLSTIIRNTDEHNKAILRAQAEASREAKAERDEQERSERKARALEATEAERLRRLMGGSSRRRDTTWDRRRDGGRRRGSRDSFEGDEEEERRDHRKRRRHSQSRSPSRKDDAYDRLKRRHHRDEEYEKESASRKRRQYPKSETRDRERRKRDRCRGHDRREESIERHTRSKGMGREREEDEVPLIPSSRTSTQGTSRNDAASVPLDKDDAGSSKQSSRLMSPERTASPTGLAAQFKERKDKLASTPPLPPSPTLSEEEDIERYRPRRRARAPPETNQVDDSPGTLPSKMDKYFEETYDPRLDTGPLVVPDIPSSGLLDGSEFEAWEAMLDVIRQRREDKAERKRLERLGLLPDTHLNEKESKVLKGSEAWTMDSGTSALDIKYNKRGTVREWDLGKTGL